MSNLARNPLWRSFGNFAQWRYSNQWSNREVLLLLVENYNQYPAQTEWNISAWGNFWRLLREQIIVAAWLIKLSLITVGFESSICKVERKNVKLLKKFVRYWMFFRGFPAALCESSSLEIQLTWSLNDLIFLIVSCTYCMYCLPREKSKEENKRRYNLV